MPSVPARRRLLAAAVLAALLTALAVALTPAPALAANGCGPTGFGLLVPDHPLGFDFHAACDRHDGCYATPWRDVAPTRAEARLACDHRFLDDLDASCLAGAGGRTEVCLEIGLDYYRAARTWLGDLAYARAQA